MPVRRAPVHTAIATLVCAMTFALPAHAQNAKPQRSFATSAAETAGKVWSGAQDVAIYALGMIGVDYKFGGNTPESGLDCSGLVRYVFQEVTGVTLPRTSKEMSGLGAKVSANDLKPGDLVFFNTRRFQFSHVGIYLGDNRFIHAPSAGSEVEIAACRSPTGRSISTERGASWACCRRSFPASSRPPSPANCLRASPWRCPPRNVPPAPPQLEPISKWGERPECAKARSEPRDST